MRYPLSLKAVFSSLAAILTLTVMGAASPLVKHATVKWDVDMPNAPKDKEAQLHSSREVAVNYASADLAASALISAIDMKVQMSFKKNEQGKASMQMQSSVCFTLVSAPEKPITVSVILNEKPPVVFTITKDRCQSSAENSTTVKACFPAADLTLPGFWKEVTVDVSSAAK